MTFTYVECKNPFDPGRDRTITERAVVDGAVLANYLPAVREDERLVVSVNGRVVATEEFYTLAVKPGEQVIVNHRPGDFVTAVVGWIADALVAVGVSSAIATGIAWAGGLYLGGVLVSSLYSMPDMPDMNKNQDMGKQTYGWNTIRSQEGQGGAVTMTYGTVRTAGQVLARHITTSGEKQYLNLLFSGGEGPLTFSDVRVNNNKYTNYTGVTVETRPGTNTQDIIQNFNDTFADQPLSFKLSGSFVTHSTVGSGGQGIEIIIECPNGLYYMNDEGKMQTHTVTVTAEYKLRSSSTWKSWGKWKISGKNRTGLRRSFRKDNLGMGQYDVRVNADGLKTGSRYSTDTYWTLLAHIIYDDFTYPNTGLIGIKALATDQLNTSQPAVSWVQTRTSVYVWNPGSESYQARPANNPAWAAYDVIHRCRLLNNVGGGASYVAGGVPKEQMDFDAFNAWAAFCTDKNLKINIAIDMAMDVWQILNQKIAPVGRGTVVMRGTSFSCIWDGVGEPVQLFGEGNIIAGSFEEEFLSISERANAAEITYRNKAKDYETDTVFIMGDDYNTADIAKNPVQMHFDGITDYQQVCREGAYRLALNKYLTRVIKFKADVDSIACQVGDIISVSHSVPAWGESGRVVSVVGDVITIDKPVELLPGTQYVITFRRSNDMLSTFKLVLVEEITTTDELEIDVTEHYGQPLPEADDVYAFGREDVETKPFRIVRINRNTDMIREIVALEYIEDVYKEVVVPELPGYSELIHTIRNVRVITTWGTDLKCYAGVSWIPPRYDYGGAKVVVDDVQVAHLDASETAYVFEATPNTEYIITIEPYRILGTQLDPVTTIYKTESFPIPDPPSSINVERREGNTVEVHWDYISDRVPPVWIKGYKIRVQYEDRPIWEYGIEVHDGVLTSSPHELQLRGGSAIIMVKSVTIADTESDAIAYAITELGDREIENIIWTYDLKEEEWPGDLTGGFKIPEAIIADDSNAFWQEQEHYKFWQEFKTQLFWKPVVYTTIIYEVPVFIAPYGGVFSIDYAGAGNAKIYWRLDCPDLMWDVDVNYFWRWEDNESIYNAAPWELYHTGITLPTYGRKGIESKVVIEGGSIQGKITKLTYTVDVPDIVVDLDDISIPLEGLRLDMLTSVYGMRVAKSITCTIQDDGGLALGVRIQDKDDLVAGPLIKCYDDEGIPTTALLDIRIVGY